MSARDACQDLAWLLHRNGQESHSILLQGAAGLGKNLLEDQHKPQDQRISELEFEADSQAIPHASGAVMQWAGHQPGTCAVVVKLVDTLS